MNDQSQETLNESQHSIVGYRGYKIKPKKSQIPLAILMVVFMIPFGIVIAYINFRLFVFWIFGIGFGYVLQRSRFCFTAVFRDPIITGSTSMAKAFLIALLITSCGFWLIKFVAQNKINLFAMVYENVYPIAFPMILGGLMFGIGMVIASGCASGTLMRIGEGFTSQVVTLIFFIMGSLWGAYDYGNFWSHLNNNAPLIFMPDIFGWYGALIIQLMIIWLLYKAAKIWQQKAIEKENNQGVNT